MANPIGDSKLEILNMCNSLHRFDSVVRSMTRAILAFEALIASAFTIIVVRKGKQESKDIARVMVFISGEEGIERMVLFGMMCDGGDVVLMLVRFFDTEQTDAVETTDKINDFAAKLDWLFVQGNVVTQETSYTFMMIKLLEKSAPYMWMVGLLMVTSQAPRESSSLNQEMYLQELHIIQGL